MCVYFTETRKVSISDTGERKQVKDGSQWWHLQYQLHSNLEHAFILTLKMYVTNLLWEFEQNKVTQWRLN